MTKNQPANRTNISKYTYATIIKLTRPQIVDIVLIVCYNIYVIFLTWRKKK